MNCFFKGSGGTNTKAQTMKAMDFDYYKIHYRCQTLLTVFKNITELVRTDVSPSISH
jgi:hypothetical protein